MVLNHWETTNLSVLRLDVEYKSRLDALEMEVEVRDGMEGVYDELYHCGGKWRRSQHISSISLSVIKGSLKPERQVKNRTDDGIGMGRSREGIVESEKGERGREGEIHLARKWRNDE